jgi:uncharacterized membrane protein YbhN (UPF0104 family)
MSQPQTVSKAGPTLRTRPPLKKWLESSGRVLLVLLALAPVAYSTWKNWPEVHLALVQAYWPRLAEGLVILVLAMPLMGLIPWLTLRHLGVRQSVRRVMGLYFLSQLAKYIPGGIWAYPGRMVAYEKSGVGRVQAILSVSREVVALFLGCAALALAGVFLKVQMPLWMQAATVSGILACVVAVFLTLVPAIWRWLSRIPFLRRSALAVLGDAGTTFNLRWLPGTLAVSLVFWLVTGWGFLQLARAVAPAISMNWLEAGSVFALAWCVGFVIVFLPAGFGAREIVLSYLLSNYVSTADALTIALLARFWWMAAEALYVALSPLLLLERAEPRPQR